MGDRRGARRMDDELRLDDPKVIGGGCCGILTLVGVIIFAVYMGNYAHLGPDDQVKLKEGRGFRVINGPASMQLNPTQGKEFRKATLLDALQYAVLQHRTTRVQRVVEGPQLLFLGPDDNLIGVRQKDRLERGQYIKLIDRYTAQERMVAGPAVYAPNPTEYQDGPIRRAKYLTEERAVIVLNKTSGRQELVTACSHGSRVFVPVREQEVLADRDIIHVKPFEALVVRDLDGVMNVYSGQTTDLDSIPGSCNFDETSTNHGGVSFFLPPYDRIVRFRWSSFASPDEAAEAVRTSTGTTTTTRTTTRTYTTTTITTTRQSAQVHRRRWTTTRLPQGGAVPSWWRVTWNGTGPMPGSPRYIPPMYVDNRVTSQHTSAPKQWVSAIDLRVMKSFFVYDMRSNDNVKLKIEGQIFWRINNISKMLGATDDPEGDVWHHSRSQLIQVVSNRTLSTLMEDVNAIMSAVSLMYANDSFYDERGLQVVSMELTKFQPLDNRTVATLQQIIRQTTQRMTELVKAQSNNEVRAEALAADIAIEANRTLLLEALALNARLLAETTGSTAGGRVAQSIAAFLDTLSSTLPELPQRLEMFKEHERRQASKKDTFNLATGNAKMILKPENMSLRLQMPARSGR